MTQEKKIRIGLIGTGEIINQGIIDGIVRSSKLGREVEIEIPEV